MPKTPISCQLFASSLRNNETVQLNRREEWKFKRFWISRLREIIVEVAVARGDEEEEPDEEVGPEDTENGSKGIEEMNDEVHVIDIVYL